MIHIDNTLIESLSNQASKTLRKRLNYNFHETASDPLHRMLNAVEPFSYVCPHKHENPDKREAFIILQGSMLVIQFDNIGNITDHIILNHSTKSFGVEIPPATYHTIIALETGTVVYEVKDGPWEMSTDKGFASWAPLEDSNESQFYLMELLKRVGCNYTNDPT